MKKSLLLFFSLTFLFANSQVSFIKNSILNNEESYIAPIYRDSIFEYYHNKENAIADSFINKIKKSPLVSAFVDDSSMLVNIKETIKYNCIASYNDPRVNPVLNNVQHNPFNLFLHNLIKIKRVREFAAELVKDILVEQCKIYPQDFKESYIEELTELLSFIKTIPEHKYRIGNNYSLLYIDDNEEDDLSRDMRGFVLRRYLIDKIPLEELENYIKKTLFAIKSIDVSSNPKFIFEEYINDNMKYTISSYGNFYQIGKSEIILVYDDLRDFFERSRMICHTDGKETIYTIEGGSIYKGKWNSSNEKTIVDSNGEILSQY